MTHKPLLPALLVTLLTTLLTTASLTALAEEAAKAGAPAKTAVPVSAPAAPAPQASVKIDPNKPIAIVNGVAIPPIFGDLLRQSGQNQGLRPEALNAEAVRESLISLEVLAQEARRKGADKSPLIAAAMELQTKELLKQALIENYAKDHPIAEETLKAEYDKAKAAASEMEYQTRHILVEDEKLAKEILTQLNNKKAKFEDLAKKHSKDSSAGSGGDLGWVQPGRLVPEFAEAMAKLKKGETAKSAVKTRFGWHIIRVDDVRKLDFPTYDKVKGRIANQLQQKAVHKYVQELRAAAKVE